MARCFSTCLLVATIAGLCLLPGMHAIPTPAAVSRKPTCGNVQPYELMEPVAFDCAAFGTPDINQCYNKPESYDQEANIANCCECVTIVNDPLDLTVTMSKAVKVSGQAPPPVIAVGDVLSYTIIVSAQSCLGGELKDVEMIDQLPVGKFQDIQVTETDVPVCSVDQQTQRLTCRWSSIACRTEKQVTITGTVTQAGKLTHCALAATASGEDGENPNQACAKPVNVVATALGSCCTRSGSCITRMTKGDCVKRIPEGGIGGQKWYAGKAVCPTSCRSIRASATQAAAAGVTAAAAAEGGAVSDTAAAAGAGAEDVAAAAATVPPAGAVDAAEPAAAAAEEAAAPEAQGQ